MAGTAPSAPGFKFSAGVAKDEFPLQEAQSEDLNPGCCRNRDRQCLDLQLQGYSKVLQYLSYG